MQVAAKRCANGSLPNGDATRYGAGIALDRWRRNGLQRNAFASKTPANPQPAPDGRSSNESIVMSKSNGRTGARGRANIAPPPPPAQIAAARSEIVKCESWLSELATAHPSAKIWRTRLKAAQAVMARAPQDS